MIFTNTQLGYNKLLSFQLGGSIATTSQSEEPDPAQLIYVLSSLMKTTKKKPKGGDSNSIMEFISSYPQEAQVFMEEYKTKTPEDLQQDKEFMQLYSVLMKDQQQYAKKGAKLKKLKDQSAIKKANKEITKAISNPVITQGKSGMKTKKRKCACGCDLVLSKEKGGKITEKCACNCKGGKMKKK